MGSKNTVYLIIGVWALHDSYQLQKVSTGYHRSQNHLTSKAHVMESVTWNKHINMEQYAPERVCIGKCYPKLSDEKCDAMIIHLSGFGMSMTTVVDGVVQQWWFLRRSGC